MIVLFNETVVCTENLDSDVVMVKPAEDRVRTNASGLMNRTRNRRILVQRPMRSDGVVVIDPLLVRRRTSPRAYKRSLSQGLC
jgi:hypothetical protein